MAFSGDAPLFSLLRTFTSDGDQEEGGPNGGGKPLLDGLRQCVIFQTWRRGTTRDQ